MKLRRACGYFLATVALSIGVFPDKVTAQISSDGSLSTTVSTDDAVNFLIEGGERSLDNLFHSFSEFSIPNFGEAYFNNTTDITNIFSRVIGGSISEIQGLIRANGTANLFLINPAGIVFGENASLDVGGSFFATTAESLVFGDGVEFSATQPQEVPLLTVNITPGLQMGANSGSITVQGNSTSTSALQVQPGQTLALVGGEIDIAGANLIASDGQIELWAVGNAEISMDTQPWQLASSADSADWGTITLRQNSSVDTSGIDGGGINIRGRGLTLKEGSNIISRTFAGEGKGITVNTTEFVELLGGGDPTADNAIINTIEGIHATVGNHPFLRPTSDSFLASVISEQSATGRAGNVTIETNNLRLVNNGWISSITTGNNSRAADVTVRATDISLEGNETTAGNVTSVITSLIDGGNNNRSGKITLDAQRISILKGSRISSSVVVGNGQAGEVSIRAAESLEIRDVNPFNGTSGGVFATLEAGTTGQGGQINIETGSLVVSNGGIITSEMVGAQTGFFGPQPGAVGTAGSINIQAREIQVREPVIDGLSQAVTGITTSLGDGAVGSGGDINLVADSLRVFNGGQITSSSFGEGAAGSVNLQVSNLEVEGISPYPLNGQFLPSAITAASANSFAAGFVNIEADTVNVGDRALISVSNTGTGNAGNLNINADNIFLDTQGSLQGEVTAGNQGNINLTSQFLLLRNNSNITTNAGEQANGGNITIDTVNLVSLEDSDITANAVFGRGGNIIINAQGLFLSLDSDITASSEFGIDGVVEINTPDEENKLAIAELPANFTDASNQIVGNCSWTRDNTFYVVGRRGIAKTPQEHIEIYQMWSDIRDLSEFESATVIRESSPRQENTIVEANAMIINEDGKVELVAVVPNNNHNLGQVASSCSGEVGS